VQKRITRDEVYIADEAFFTGTAAEVTPIRELDRVEIGAGSRGPLTEKIQARSLTSSTDAIRSTPTGSQRSDHVPSCCSIARQGPEPTGRRVLPP